MARSQARLNTKHAQPPPVPDHEGQGKPAQAVKNQQTPRKSLRLRAIRQSYKQSSSKSNHIQGIQGIQVPLSPPPSKILRGETASSRKRKRELLEEERAGHPSSQAQKQLPSKPLQSSPPSSLDKETSHQVLAIENSHQTSASEISEGSVDPLLYWIATGRWHRQYFEQDSEVIEDFERGKSPEELKEDLKQDCRTREERSRSREEAEQRNRLQEHNIRERYRAIHAYSYLQHLLARTRSSSSLSRKNSRSSLQTPSDQLPRETKSAQYRSPDYVVQLEGEGSYMFKSTLGITDASRELCRTLLEEEQSVPQDTLFRDDLFDETCRKIQTRNKAMVIRDIGLLIVPSAQTLATYGAVHLNHLYETTNEGWNSIFSFPLHRTRPQPDYSVGFG